MNDINMTGKKLIQTRSAFPMFVECIALEIIELSKDVAPAIGEISLDEAVNVIIREFSIKMRERLIIG